MVWAKATWLDAVWKGQGEGHGFMYAGLQQPGPENKGNPGARVKPQGIGSDLNLAKSSPAAMGRRD